MQYGRNMASNLLVEHVRGLLGAGQIATAAVGWR